MKFSAGIPAACASAVLALAAAGAFAASELAPRKTLGPLDRAKVLQVESKMWLQNNGGGNAVQDTTTLTSPGGSKACVTNVGVPQQANATTPGGRFGPQNPFAPQNSKDNIVVVKGDVISVCK